MRLRCPICTTVVQFEHRHLVDGMGYVECGHCGGKFQLAIAPGVGDDELDDLETVEEHLQVYDVDGVAIRRQKVAGDWEQSPTGESAARQFQQGKKKTLFLLILCCLLVLLIIAGGFYAFLLPKEVEGVTSSGLVVAEKVVAPEGADVPEEQGAKVAQDEGAAPSVSAENTLSDAGSENEVVAEEVVDVEEEEASSEKADSSPAVAANTPDGEQEQNLPSSDTDLHVPDANHAAPNAGTQDTEDIADQAKKSSRKKNRRPSIKTASSGSTEKLTGKSIPELLSLADSYQSKGDTKAAIRAYETVISKDRNNIEANFGLGKTYLSTKRASLALERFRTVIRNGGGRGGRAYIYAARCEKDLGHIVNAKEFYEDYLRKYPNGGFSGEARSFIDSH